MSISAAGHSTCALSGEHPQSAEGTPGISRYRSDFLRHDAWMDPGELTSAGPAAFRVMRANRHNPARRRWAMLRTLIRRMNVLSFWARRTVRGMWPPGGPLILSRSQQVEYSRRYDNHVRRYWNMRLVRKWVIQSDRERLNLRSNRRAPPSWAADRARLMPLP